MALEPTLMRNVAVAVSDGEATPTDLAIGGIQGGITHNPSTATADASTFDAAGRTRNLPVSRGDSFQVQALRIEDETDGSRDPGQERCEDLGKEVGQAALESFTLTFAGGGTVTFTGHVQVKYLGGGVNALANWEATIEVYGTPVFA